MSSSFILLSTAKNRRNKSIEEIARQYSAFQSVEEMDRHLHSFVLTIGYTLTETALKVLEYLGRHSLKAFGVSWLSVRKIAQLVGVTDRTVRRVMNQLEELQIIKRIENLRADGGRASNLIAIQPVEDLVAEDDKGDDRGDVRGGVSEVVTHNQLNHLNQKDDDDNKKSHYRYCEFFKVSDEWGVPKEAATLIFPFVREQLLTTSWVALNAAFSKLRNHATNISSIPRWFAKTLETENILHKIHVA